MDWDGIRTFLAVVRAGRLAGAARELGVEHTTVGRRLETIEAELGVKLFHRTARGFLPTADGEALLSDAEAMERNARSIERSARSSRAHGRVRIALVPEMASHWLAPRLPELRRRHPGIDLDVIAGIERLDLSRGQADLAVRTPRPRQPDLSAVRLARTQTRLYAARALVGDPPRTLAELLASEPLLAYPAEHRALQSADWFQPVLRDARAIVVTNSSAAIHAAVCAGGGVGVMPTFMVRPRDDLVAFGDTMAPQEVWLVTHREFRKDPLIHATHAFLREIGPDLEPGPQP